MALHQIVARASTVAAQTHCRTSARLRESRQGAQEQLHRQEDGVVRFASLEEIVRAAQRLVESDEDTSMHILSRASDDLVRYEIELNELGIPFRNNSGESFFNLSKDFRVVRALIGIRTGKAVSCLDARLMVANVSGKLLEKTSSQVVEEIKGDPESTISVQDLRKAGVNVDAIYTYNDLVELIKMVKRIRPARVQVYARVLRNIGPDVFSIAPRITLSTIHSDKGSQAGIVALSLKQPVPVVVAEGELDLVSIEAERRVMYVGLTRTKHTLLIEEAAAGR